MVSTQRLVVSEAHRHTLCYRTTLLLGLHLRRVSPILPCFRLVLTNLKLSRTLRPLRRHRAMAYGAGTSPCLFSQQQGHRG
jgi:hypothetical protein